MGADGRAEEAQSAHGSQCQVALRRFSAVPHAPRLRPHPRIPGGLHVVTERELAGRERAVMDARRTSELEGSRSTPSTRADQDAYRRGEIDLAQLGIRVRQRYGLL